MNVIMKSWLCTDAEQQQKNESLKAQLEYPVWHPVGQAANKSEHTA